MQISRVFRFVALLTAVCLWTGCSHPDPEFRGQRVSQWIDRFNDPNPQQVEEAVDALVHCGEEALPRIVQALHGSDFEVRSGAAAVLLRSGHEATVAQLFEGADIEGKLSLASAMFASGSTSRQAVKAVLGALKHENPDIRHAAVHVLGDLNAASQPAVPALADALQSPDADVRFRAVYGLVRIGPAAHEAMPALMAALKDPDARVRQGAVQALASIAPDANPVRDALAALREDPDPQVRYQVETLLRR